MTSCDLVQSASETRRWDFHISISPALQLSSSPGFQVSRSPGLQVSRFPGLQVSSSPGLQVSSSPGLQCPAPEALVGTRVSPTPSEPQRGEAPAHQGAPENLSTDLSSSSDGGDMSCCDLLSLGSETTRKSEDDDTRSVTASSVTSLFHRVQLDPLEKAWLRSSALGNTAAQRQLLAQEPGLVLKKDFITVSRSSSLHHEQFVTN
ncbi:ankyrin repeat domain-containing protein SOWAHC-like [Platichthys flesus]|uniref:ankyrin repeat domain-containing protein SOWAHC-like n=1 Tax=Platichthys flesus TaxID=8260 RepID=UPI002DBD2F65|nr:ankyrin repeat domain-containing protein SOWAHC-like [Platichthys flesus]